MMGCDFRLQYALLAIAHQEGAVGDQGKVRCRVVGKIILSIPHAVLLIAANKQRKAASGFDAQVLKAPQNVEKADCGAFVVVRAAAYQKGVLLEQASKRAL